MKSSGERNYGGELKQEYKQVWADYICRYIKEYRKRGYLIQRISLQNEPKAVQTWDSCIYTAQQEKEFLRDYMWPALQENELSDVEVFIWDHFEALSMIHDKFPDKKLILSEACIEYRNFPADDCLKNAQKYAHDMIGNMNHGMNAFYDWNVVLDENLWHFTHFIKPGAVRIGISGYSDELEATAFTNPDGGIVAVLLNRTHHDIIVNVRIEDKMAEIVIEPDSIVTIVI